MRSGRLLQTDLIQKWQTALRITGDDHPPTDQVNIELPSREYIAAHSWIVKNPRKQRKLMHGDLAGLTRAEYHIQWQAKRRRLLGIELKNVKHPELAGLPRREYMRRLAAKRRKAKKE